MPNVQPNTAGSELRAMLPVSPDAYVQNIDVVRGLVLVIRMDANAYRLASFLDDRILGPMVRGAWLAGADATAAARQVTDPQPLHFIFHTGHVGSTLASRLLDETGVVLPLREPLPLRVIADAWEVLTMPESLLGPEQFDALVGMMLRFWSRGYDWTRAVVVKATSSAGHAAIPLLEARPEARAIYMNLHAEPYLAALLAGANSATDLRGHAPGRIRRLHARGKAVPAPLHRMSSGELAALGWLVETLAQQDAVRRFPDRVLAIDFDTLLADVAGCMRSVTAHFGLPPDAAYQAGIGASPALQRYSKAPERPFAPEEREQRLAESRRDNRDEIMRGMHWLERMGAT
jgi:hypothetical protein